MALHQRLETRQTQTLTMTPQLMQAIKLLQLSHADLLAYIENEIEQNPLLDIERPQNSKEEDTDLLLHEPSMQVGERLNVDKKTLEEQLDTNLDNDFPDDNPVSSFKHSNSNTEAGGDDFQEYTAAKLSLWDHLKQQLDYSVRDPIEYRIGLYLIDAIDQSGYLTIDIDNAVEQLGVSAEQIENLISILQGFEPVGVGARSLSECLSLQLKEQGRFDPLIELCLKHLDLVAKHDYSQLRRLCQTDEEDLKDMIGEIKRLDPRPGYQFETPLAETVIPDVIITKGQDGLWKVDLNSETLPKLLVRHGLYSRIVDTAKTDHDKDFMQNCLQNATWLTKALDQRANTILNVASEIIRQQDAFLEYGVHYLRPLNLKTVADAVGIHESTVSRVTANKYMETPRGVFELKYFFSNGLQSSSGVDHAAESIRHTIKQMIDDENPKKILSDDKIVTLLKAQGIDVARRTVAKYREAMKIPSSVQRRREKSALQ